VSSCVRHGCNPLERFFSEWGHEAKRSFDLGFFFIEAKRTWLIPKILKIDAKRTLLIQELTKIEAKRPLLIPDIRKIKAKRTLLIPYNRKS
jgi:hypothetical protein